MITTKMIKSQMLIWCLWQDSSYSAEGWSNYVKGTPLPVLANMEMIPRTLGLKMSEREKRPKWQQFNVEVLTNQQ